MEIQKAIEHLEWKFRHVWKPSEKDIEALNSIIMFKKQSESKNLSDNDALAKLWIHQLILLNQKELYSAESAIRTIDEILNASVYDWCLALKDNITMMNWNVVFGRYPEYLDAINKGNLTKSKIISQKIIEENQAELSNILKKQVDENNIISFVETQITRILNDF